jgi:DNA-binding IclR family transcriptional regulator
MSEVVMPTESNRSPRAAAMKRGLPTVDAFLVLAALKDSTMLSMLRVEMLKRGIAYSKRTLWNALRELANAGYVIHERGYYAPAPTVFPSPKRFLPLMNPGIAEVDLLLLVLSGVKRPKHMFLALWGDAKLTKHIYYDTMRRLIRLGYLERDRGWWYHPGKRTMALLGYNPEYAH